MAGTVSLTELKQCSRRVHIRFLGRPLQAILSLPALLSAACGTSPHWDYRRLMMGSAVDKVIAASFIIAMFIHISSTEKNFLNDYEPIPGREVDGIRPSSVINGTDAESCARNCSTENRFQCLHFEHRPSICHIFSFQRRAYTKASDSWTIYTKNRAALAGIPKGGASSLTGGSASLFRLLMMFVGAAVLFLMA